TFPTNTFWKLLKEVYSVLNATTPNLTEHCWLCFDVRPLFYEAVGVQTKFRLSNQTNPSQCNWNDPQTKGVTLTDVTGKGRCIG
ncbi:ENV2 protein, partial [Vireo altiloquus]|nr:ENV2 protein [Vireo altiloquus]